MRHAPLAHRLLVPPTVVVIAFVLAAAARGDVFEPIQLASLTPTEQANSAADTALSANGRYLTFDGSVTGVSGVWRRDLLTGAVQPVAAGDAENAAIDAPDARLPSISADGRFISFTTTAPLDPGVDANEAPDVYVRDMAVAADQPGAYTLASAVDGSAQGLSYDFGGQPSFGRGSLASGRSAITADGRDVVFVTTARTNLADPAVVDTPPLQVAVRDLDAERTRLVSVEYDSASGQMTDRPVPVSGENGETRGAVFHPERQTPVFPTSFQAAAISADGSTVAWMGQSIAKQARVLASDPALDPSYSEPLWRRIADGPQAPTRRVTGGSDPANPACPSEAVQVTQPATLSDPCQGPFEPLQAEGMLGVYTLGTTDQLPRLSADGRTVAFLANAREIAGGEQFGLAANSSDDLYVADMAEGLTRQQALRRLTEIASSNSSDLGRVAPIVDFEISPDASQVAFSTLRTTFPLGSPAYVTAPAASAAAEELFDADLENDTLTRVTQGYEGGVSEPAKASVAAPSFSADGNTLAFSSSAYNLVYGDGNGASDAFVVRRKRFPEVLVAQSISPPPAGPSLQPEWRLALSARSLRDGSVALEVSVPGAGGLRASADGAVLIRRRHAKRGHGARGRLGSTVATRRLAAANKSIAAGGSGIASVRLTAGRRYRALIAKRGGLSATVTVTFAAAGHKTLRARLPVTFARKRSGHKPGVRTR
jgi:WD40-like Beta Propeller Repeat